MFVLVPGADCGLCPWKCEPVLPIVDCGSTKSLGETEVCDDGLLRGLLGSVLLGLMR